MQKIETTEIKEFERNGVSNAINNRPIVHQRGFLSISIRSRASVLGLCTPRHCNQCRLVNGNLERDQNPFNPGFKRHSQCLRPTGKYFVFLSITILSYHQVSR